MTQNAVDSINPFLQMVSATTGAGSNNTAQIPYDNSIPQIGEGTQILSASITPKFATSTLEITFSGLLEKVSAGAILISLFQDSNANAIAAKAQMSGDQNDSMGDLQHVMTSGTTSSTTFTIRIGPSSNSLDINATSANSNNRVLGGVCSTILIIKEYL